MIIFINQNIYCYSERNNRRVDEWYSANQSLQYDFVIRSNSMDIFDLYDEVMQIQKEPMKNSFLSVSGSLIYFTDTFEDFWKTLKNTDYPLVLKATYRHLVYCREASSSEIEKRFHKETKYQFEQIRVSTTFASLIYSFLFEENGDVVLRSLAMHSSKLCGTSHLIEINRFSRKMSTWTTKNYFAIDDYIFWDAKSQLVEKGY